MIPLDAEPSDAQKEEKQRFPQYDFKAHAP